MEQSDQQENPELKTLKSTKINRPVSSPESIWAKVAHFSGGRELRGEAIIPLTRWSAPNDESGLRVRIGPQLPLMSE